MIEKYKYKIGPSQIKDEFVTLNIMLTSTVDNVAINEVIYESSTKEVHYKYDNDMLIVDVDYIIKNDSGYLIVLKVPELHTAYNVGDTISISGTKAIINQVSDDSISILPNQFNFEFSNSNLKVIKRILNFDLPKIGNELMILASGTTTSKLSLIKNSFNGGIIKVGERVKLVGYDDFGVVISKNNKETKYILFLNSNQPITYIDNSEGVTTFSYNIEYDDYNHNNVYSVKYKGIVEEPKITSDVFINRGVNSVFDGVKKLKHINNITELEKTGLNYFNIKIKGEN